MHIQWKVLPYSKQHLYNIVANVEAYPEFLIWLKSAKITKQTNANSFEADLEIGYQGIRSTYRSLVNLYDNSITAVAVPNNFIKALNTTWTFEKIDDDTTKVTIQVDLKMVSLLLEWTLGKVLDSVSKKLMGAFEQRAKALFNTSHH